MKIIEKQFCTTGFVTIISAGCVMKMVLYDFSHDAKTFPLVLILFFVGCLGATTTQYRRLYAIRYTDDELRARASSFSFFVQSITSPVLGGVFAVIAYLVFGGGLLKGPLFPAFDHGNETYTDLKGFFALVPKNNCQVAMMFIWAFVAGFSEKFVPNLLDRLSSEADDNQRRPDLRQPSIASKTR